MTNEVSIPCWSASPPTWHKMELRNDCPHCEITQLRGNLSLAEEGLASAMQEIQTLTEDRAQDQHRLFHYECAIADQGAEIERKNSLIDAQDAAQTSLHAENVRLREENEQLQSRLENSQAAAAMDERELERLRMRLKRYEPVSLYNGHDIDWWKAEAERLRTTLRQLAHKAGEELGGFHSLVTFAEEALGNELTAHEPCEQPVATPGANSTSEDSSPTIESSGPWGLLRIGAGIPPDGAPSMPEGGPGGAGSEKSAVCPTCARNGVVDVIDELEGAPRRIEPCEQHLRTPQGEPALTQTDGLPGTREPVVTAPQGIAGESPALFNCGYDPTAHGWVIREGSREGLWVACFLREEDANGYVIPPHALRMEGAPRGAGSKPCECLVRDKEPSAYHNVNCPRYVADLL